VAYFFFQGSLDAFNAKQEEMQRKKDEKNAADRARAINEALFYPSIKHRQESVRVLAPVLTTPAW
jgi:hypothetical protein